MHSATAIGEIDDLVQGVRDRRCAPADALTQLAAIAERRGGTRGRRRDGAYFTADDVGSWLARRAIVCAVADGLGLHRFDAVLQRGGDDLLAALEVEIAGFVASGERDAATRALEVLVRLQVLDPTCGAGSLLVAALRELVAVERLLRKLARATTGDLAWCALRVSPAQLHGIDIDDVAAAACRASIEVAAHELEIEGAGADDPEVVVADAVATPLRDLLPRLDGAGGAAVVIGNPPFVRAPATAGARFETARAANLAAWVTEQAVAAAAPGARVALVLPISAVCTDQWGGVRALWHREMRAAWASHFDAIPCTLFPGVVQRISLLEGVREVAFAENASSAAAPENASDCRWHSSTFHRWQSREREGLLERVHLVPVARRSARDWIPKVGSQLEVELLERLRSHPDGSRLLDLTRRGVRPGASGTIAYKRRWSYFLLFTDFVPEIWAADGERRDPSELKAIAAAPGIDPRVLIAIWSSTLFWWYFSVATDNRNVNVRDLAAFPIPKLDNARMRRLAAMGERLLVELRACGEVRTCTYESVGTIRNTYYRQGATRPVLDVIDRELAEWYGLRERELDFVLEFERRFRS